MRTVLTEVCVCVCSVSLSLGFNTGNPGNKLLRQLFFLRRCVQLKLTQRAFAQRQMIK